MFYNKRRQWRMLTIVDHIEIKNRVIRTLTLQFTLEEPEDTHLRVQRYLSNYSTLL